MKLVDHPLFVQVTLQMSELVERLEKVPGFRERLTYMGTKADEPKPPVFDSRLDEKYAIRVFYKLHAAAVCHKRIENVIVLIQRYPSDPSYPDAVITRSEWMDYHLSQCIVNLSTMLDVTIRLIEAVYDLGLPERQCSKKTVTENRHIDITIRTAVNGFDREIQTHKATRNADLHEARRPSFLDYVEDSGGDKYYIARAVFMVDTVHRGHPVAEQLPDLTTYLEFLGEDLEGCLYELAAKSSTYAGSLLTLLQPIYQKQLSVKARDHRNTLIKVARKHGARPKLL